MKRDQTHLDRWRSWRRSGWTSIKTNHFIWKDIFKLENFFLLWSAWHRNYLIHKKTQAKVAECFVSSWWMLTAGGDVSWYEKLHWPKTFGNNRWGTKQSFQGKITSWDYIWNLIVKHNCLIESLPVFYLLWLSHLS